MTTDRAADTGAHADAGAGDWRSHDRAVQEFAADGHVLTDGLGVVVEANRAASELLRCPKEFLAGKPLGLFVAPGHRPRFYASLCRLHSGTPADEFETVIGRRGEFRDVLVRASAVPGFPAASTLLWLLRDVTELRRSERARADLLQRLVTAQEDERRRVARELHDSVGQLLSALLLNVRAVRDAGPLPPAALARLDDVQRVAEELGRSTHDLATRLRPTALDDLGLAAALQQLLEEWSARTGVAVEFQPVGLERGRLPAEVETALYRVVQEALTNVLKHAGARRVGVVVGRPDGHAVAIVEDDGRGFDTDAAAATGRLGLTGMRERVALLGGRIQVESSPGSGATVIARIPLP